MATVAQISSLLPAVNGRTISTLLGKASAFVKPALKKVFSIFTSTAQKTFEIPSIDLTAQKVAIITYSLGGFGDLGNAMKFAKMLHEEQGVREDKILLVTDKPEGMQLFNTDGKFSVLSMREYEKKISAVGLQIITPVSEDCQISEWAKKGVRTVALYEYGFNGPSTTSGKDVQVYAFGLDWQRREVGIWIARDWRRKHEIAAAEPALRLRSLKEIEPSLQKLLRVDRGVEKFAQDSHLYLGYADDFSMQVDFVKAILAEKRKAASDKNFYFVLPGEKNARFLSAHFEEELQLHRFNKLLITKHGKCLQEIQGTGEGVLHIILGNQTHEDFYRLMTASEREVVVTGDQSLSEAIENDKIFCYEERRHKGPLARELNALYAPCVPCIIPFYGESISKMRDVFSSRGEGFFANNRRICEMLNVRHFFSKLFKRAV